MKTLSGVRSAFTAQTVAVCCAVVFVVGLFVGVSIPRKPVQVLREIPVTNVVEVPRRLSDEQTRQMAVGSDVLNVKDVNGEDGALYKMNVFGLAVDAVGAITNVTSTDRLRHTLELALRKHGIETVATSPQFIIHLVVDGMWNKVALGSSSQLNILFFRTDLSVSDIVILRRDGDYRKSEAIVFDESRIASVGKSEAEKRILDEIEIRAERFAAAYLRAQNEEATNHAAMGSSNSPLQYDFQWAAHRRLDWVGCQPTLDACAPACSIP
jgi:hypothetical protein